MKFIILVLVCIFCGHHSIPLEGSEPVLINSKVEQIPDVTSEVIKSTTAGEKLDIGPLIISTTTPASTTILSTLTTRNETTTSTVSTTSVGTPTSTNSSITTPASPTPASSTPKSTPPPTHKPPTTPQSSPKPPTTLHPSSTTDPNSRPTNPPIASSTSTIPTNRGFDGPSFIGGIVLAAGLMAIGFVAFKFYKARTELNYHTL
ncbi:hypothetical protein WA026_005959 [Henosepilachna vigintioctopunctata]|uniref:Uncharacterized protein n=1 Tax=Henosepilachna vigintioctopunctata TaxID=420089 RepID=A0AAW1U3D6_9CUCU